MECNYFQPFFVAQKGNVFLVSRIFFASICCISPHLSRILGDQEYSPVALQQRMAAELQYLETIEESVRQLGDVERLIGVSMARQESLSLAQMLQVISKYSL